MIFLLAFRNLVKNIRHSLIVVFLIMIIIALFYIGNTVLGESSEGLRKTYIRNYTGDVVIQKKTDTSMSLFGANTPAIGEFFSIPVLGNHEEILSVVAKMDGVHSVTSIISGPGAMDVQGERQAVFLFGVEAESYFKVFPGIKLEEGHFLAAGERGAMITRGNALSIGQRTGKMPVIGDPIMFTTAGTQGFKIREVALAGIFSYDNEGQVPNQIVLSDSQTARALNSILLAVEEKNPPLPEATDILTDDIDSLFGAPEAAPAATGPAVSISELQAELEQDEKILDSRWSEGSWNFVIIRLADGVSDSDFCRRLDSRLGTFGARAIDWSAAAGAPALLVVLLRYIFNSGLVLILLAGIIAIVNILLISVFQRTREIGTLRAIGASDGFVRILIFAENTIIAFVAGFLGIAAGSSVIHLVNLSTITIGNNLIAAMLGQRTIAIGFSGTTAIASVVVSVIFGLFSSIYPVQMALKIQPVEAVAKG